MKQSILQIRLDYSTPIELTDLNKLFTGIIKQYNKFIEESDLELDISKSRLCLEKVDKGSAIFDLIPCDVLIPAALVCLNNANVMFEFGKNINKLLQSFSSRTDLDKVSKSDCADVRQITELTAKDPQGTLSGVVISGDNNTIQVFNVNYEKANIIQNQAQKLETELLQSVESGYPNVLLKIHQIKDAKHPKTGEKGIVESITKSPVRLRFASPKDHDKVIEDPFGKIYLVDLNVETIDNKPCLYVVNQIIDIYEKEEL